MPGSGPTYTGARTPEAIQLAAEQAALRRVATLVARQSSEAEIFDAVAEELGGVLGVEAIRMLRFDEPGDGSVFVTVLATWGENPEVLELGERYPLGGENVTTEVFETRGSVRRDDYSTATGAIAERVRRAGIGSAVGAPITVAGRLWGAMVASAVEGGPFPPDTELRLGQFTELMGVAIANAESRAEVGRLADEQAALRRVATMVAEGPPATELFDKVAEEVANLLGGHIDSGIVRFEADETAQVVGVWGDPPPAGLRLGARHPVAGSGVAARVYQERVPIRIDAYASAEGAIAEQAKTHGIRSAVGCPIVVQGVLWGAMVVAQHEEKPFRAGTEQRVAQFTQLVATAIANAEARSEVQRLLDEQASLRRVATLVAQDAAPTEVFDAAIAEVAELLDAAQVALHRFEVPGESRMLSQNIPLADDLAVGARIPMDGDSAVIRVLRTGRPAWIDLRTEGEGPIAEAARSKGINAGVAAPITVAGEIWGAVAASWDTDHPPAAGVEKRLAKFAQLLDTAISNTEARGEVQRLLDEQAALRRVATLVAQGAEPSDVFEGVIAEARAFLGGAQASLMRFENHEEAKILAAEADGPIITEPGTTLPLVGDTVTVRVFETGQPARINISEEGMGPAAEILRRNNTAATVGAPITVEGTLWGVLVVSWEPGPSPPSNAENRLAKFAGLLETAIANAEARTEVRRLADEQAALRRVATLVAKRVAAADVFDAVIAEAGNLLAAEQVGLARFENHEEITILAMRGDEAAIAESGTRLRIDGDSMTTRVLATERPSRINLAEEGWGAIAEVARRSGVNATVGAPVRVEGRLWGVITASWKGDEVPFSGAESRLAEFAGLLETAIASAEARGQLQRLAREQTAFRRVATLVAEGAVPTEVFGAVTVEVAELLDAAQVGLMRAEDSGEITILANRGQPPGAVHPGMRLSLDGDSVTARVLASGRSARMNFYEQREGPIAAIARNSNINVTVGAPVTVEGALWGVITASWLDDDKPPDDAEERLAEFAELLDTAIANADSRDQLTASRSRVLSAGDEARRRLVRDLHDGAQQRLVHAIVSLQLAQRAMGENDERAAALLGEALDHAQQGNSELRELAHGILPAVLTRGGLRAGVEALVSRLDLPVDVEVTTQRLPPDLEASAYFIVAEALTNVVKHSDAERAEVTAEVGEGTLRVEIRDDGIGGARAEGHGLLGIGDRAAAFGGRLVLDSPAGVGTLVAVELPVARRPR